MSNSVNRFLAPADWAVADDDMPRLNRLLNGVKTSSKVVRNSFGSKAPKLQIVLDKQLDQNMSLSHSWIIAA